MIALDAAPPELQPHVAQVKHLQGLYVRYFRGRSYAATDRLLYHELARRFEACAKATVSIEALREPLTTRIAMLRKELAEVEAAHASLTDVVSRAASLAAIANLQFLIYDRNMAGQPLATRRPMLAHRLVANLTQCLADMRAIAAKTPNPDNERNIGIVQPMLERYLDESHKIVAERDDITRNELIRRIGSNMTTELVAYRKVKDTIEIEALAGYCDRVGELQYQMLELTGETDDSVNQSNLRLATRALDGLETAYEMLLSRPSTVNVAQVAESGPSLRAAIACADVPEARRTEAIGKLEAFLQDPLVRQLVVDARQKR